MRPDDRLASGVSPRRQHLLELSYRYALRHGIAALSLRPLAREIGSSPRVLLYLFGSKDELIGEILARARADQCAAITHLRNPRDNTDLTAAPRALWRWLAAAEQRPLLKLWVEAYLESLRHPRGAPATFVHQVADDWLNMLTDAQAPQRRADVPEVAQPTLVLAVLRGALLDLLQTHDHERIDAAVEHYLRSLRPPSHHAAAVSASAPGETVALGR